MKKNLVLCISISLVVLLVETSFLLGLFAKLESTFEDVLVTTKPFNPDIVLLAIDNESLSSIGQWPWPRDVYAHMLRILESVHPKAIGIDIAFFEHSRISTKDDDVFSASLASTTYPVILSAEADSLILDTQAIPRAGMLRLPLSSFFTSPQITTGHTNLVLDRDGVVRRFPLSIVFGEARSILPAFSYQIFTQIRKTTSDDMGLGVMPRIVYSRAPGTIRKIPFSHIFENTRLISQLAGKIILVGITAPDLHDTKLTPISHGIEMSGVEIQANVLNMLLYGYRLVFVPIRVMQLWLLIAILIPLIFFRRYKGISRPLIASSMVGIIHNILIIIFFEYGFIANIIHINLAWSFSTLTLFGYTYFTTEKERREMRKLFSKYVATDVLEYVMRNPEKVSLGGEEKEVTILFSDIRSYTTFSESVTPKELVRVLNRYLTAMTEEVLKNKGVLDKYIGDAVMAYWGAPIDDPDQADHALKTALGMIKRLETFNAELRAEGIQEIHFGIGIYSGPVIVGNVGSEMRLEYTVVGDTVNVASRLEGVNKELGTTILLGESAKNKIKGKYTFKSMGSVSVKGRKEPLHVYTIEGI